MRKSRSPLAGTALIVALLCLAASISYSKGHATPTLTVLHSFQGFPGDGAFPDAPLVIGSGGVLYGSTFYGGSGISCGVPGCGTVFSLTPPSIPGGDWTETLLHDFAAGGTLDGNYPIGGLAIGAGGVLYGVTYAGGNLSAGTVFSLTPPAGGSGAWIEAVLYNFILGSKAGAFPISGLVADKKGVLYGTTYFGGASGLGTIYSLTPPKSPGGVWIPAVLYSFPGGAAGANPIGGLLLGSGVLYGTTSAGGASGFGTVYSLTPGSGGVWTEAVLHSFGGPTADGAIPLSALTLGNAGVIFGTTVGGGAYGRGTAFSLTPPAAPGGSWTESVLYSFTGGSDGGQPRSGVTIVNGSLFGTTYNGAAGGYGAVFALIPPTPPSNSWTETVPFSFPGGSAGSNPQAGVVVGAAGLLYGVTYGGGTSNFGTVFSLQQ
jgi:uncharacterized repeat protein (TIGR03803 family)